MKPARSSPILPVGLVLVATGSLGALLASPSCSREAGPPEPAQGSGTATGQPVLDDATQQTLEQLFGSAGHGELSPPPFELPALRMTVQSEGLPVRGTWREHPLLHDFDGDGRADLVASNREEDGLNAWRAPAGPDAPWELRIAGFPRDLMYGGSDAADLDGDGHQDLVFAAHGRGLVAFRGDGAMENWELLPEPENADLVLDIALGDLNGDGHHDVAGIGHFEGGLAVWVGDGTGAFRRLPESRGALRDSRFGMAVELADLDADGLDDVVLAAEEGPTVLYTRRTEDGAGLTWVDGSQGLPRTSIGNATRDAVTGDFDGDGTLEVAFCALADNSASEGERDDVGVYRREGETWVQLDRGLPKGLAFRDMDAADLDGDGHLDLVLTSFDSGVAVYRGDGTGGFTARGVLPGTRTAGRVAIGDVDADGWLDIAVLSQDTKRNPEAGGISIWINGEDVWRAE